MQPVHCTIHSTMLTITSHTHMCLHTMLYCSQAPQQQQPPPLFVQSSVASSLITGTSLIPQQQQPQQHLPSVANTNPLALAPLPPPPPEEEIDLPLNWKTARDPNGKIYYYHAITRKTQWERPTDKDAEGTITMDLGTPEPESESEGKCRKLLLRGQELPLTTLRGMREYRTLRKGHRLPRCHQNDTRVKEIHHSLIQVLQDPRDQDRNRNIKGLRVEARV